MTHDEYLERLVENNRIHPSARSIILNSAGDQILVEKNSMVPDQYCNFVGGGLELGETLE